jgi:hypothetical protein
MIRVATTEYKALTVVNLPFIEERFAPGEMIPYSRFEAMAEAGAAVTDDRTDVPMKTLLRQSRRMSRSHTSWNGERFQKIRMLSFTPIISRSIPTNSPLHPLLPV